MERLFRFQSQTRRLLPRNSRARAIPLREDVGFNRRRDACFLATKMKYCTHCGTQLFQSQTRRLLPRNAYGPNAARRETGFNRRRDACFLATGINSLYGKTVQFSISYWTLASSQLTRSRYSPTGRRRLQSQTRRLLPRNKNEILYPLRDSTVSIADATLASSQRIWPKCCKT